MQTMDALSARYTCKDFIPDKKISDEQLMQLIGAANTAPNAAPHGSPIYSSVMLTIVEDPDLISKIDEEQPGLHATHGAPTLIIVSGILENGTEIDLPLANCVCILENMLIAAADMDLGASMIFGLTRALRADKNLCADLQIPTEYEPLVMLGVGFPVKKQSPKEFSTSRIKYTRL